MNEEVFALRLSVLDQSIAVVDRPQGRHPRHHRAGAAREALGYDRFWVSEHHSNATIVGTAPEILIGGHRRRDHSASASAAPA